MKLIEPSCQLIEENNPYKLVELIGRTCYKSEYLITEDSCYKFVRNLIDREHFAMLEHGRLTFRVYPMYVPLSALANIPGLIVSECKDRSNYYIGVSMSHLYNPLWQKEEYKPCGNVFRVFRRIVESRFVPGSEQFKCYGIDLLKFSTDISSPFTFKSIKFVCDRGVTHELVRHRCAIAQESTRYCAYNKDKFNSELTFVKPVAYDNWNDSEKQFFLESLQDAENKYLKATNEFKWDAQTARGLLPHYIKADIVLTMNMPQWRHFLNMRYYETTGKSHPDCKHVAMLAKQILHI